MAFVAKVDLAYAISLDMGNEEVVEIRSAEGAVSWREQCLAFAIVHQGR